MKTPKELNSFVESYKQCFQNLNDTKEEAFFWLSNFILLFFIPIIYPVLWIYLKSKENK